MQHQRRPARAYFRVASRGPNFRTESYSAARNPDGLSSMDGRRFNYHRFGGLPRFNEARFVSLLERPSPGRIFEHDRPAGLCQLERSRVLSWRSRRRHGAGQNLMQDIDDGVSSSTPKSISLFNYYYYKFCTSTNWRKYSCLERHVACLNIRNLLNDIFNFSIFIIAIFCFKTTYIANISYVKVK